MQFGRYTLTKRVASGGMAEVWKAKASGPAGFEKTVAIKKVLANLATDPEFTAMFIAEAKLVSGLQHGNVVQVFDFGQVGDDQYYLAMEYVAGGSLAVLCKRLADAQKVLPLEVALYVITEAARGLGYAHTKTDRTEKPLGIIHRDVSPHNLLVSFDGDVKVADFGIARAESRMSVTATGTVRGKASYMSPEQARGQALDARSDLFSLGLVFYELVTGQKLFGGESTTEIMGRVAFWVTGEMTEAPPSVVPILKKILAANPGHRYADASEFEEATAAMLGSDGAKRARKALAATMREHLAPEYAAEMAVDETAVEPAAPNAPSKEKTKILADRAPAKRGRTGLLLAIAVVGAIAVWIAWPEGPQLPAPSPGAQWLAGVRGACNLLEVETRLRDTPPPPGTDGAGHAAACFVLAGKSERALQIIETLPPEERALAAQTVFDVAAVAAGADDESTVRVMELVLAYAPDNSDALLRAGLAEYRMGSDSSATAHLNHYLALNPGAGESSERAREVLARVDEFVKVRESIRSRAAATPRALVAGTSMAAIPAGCFEMGEAEGEADEAPKRRVCVGAFLLDRDEVTNARYREWLSADANRAAPVNCCNAIYDYWTPERDVPEAWAAKPVINVSWGDATAFCKWEGKRLPSEAEWEFAARGGLPAALFPWGDELPVDDATLLHGARFGAVWSSGGAIAPVGTFAANAYGLRDMAGNVWEWVDDRYREDWYLARPGESPAGPPDGECCVVRGGAWASTEPAHLRVANRLLINDERPAETLRSVGFRCAAASR